MDTDRGGINAYFQNIRKIKTTRIISQLSGIGSNFMIGHQEALSSMHVKQGRHVRMFVGRTLYRVIASKRLCMHMYALLGLISLSNRYLIHQAVESPSVQFLLLMPCIRTCVPKIAFSIGEGSLRCLSLYYLSSDYIFLNVTNKRGKNYSTFLGVMRVMRLISRDCSAAYKSTLWA